MGIGCTDEADDSLYGTDNVFGRQYSVEKPRVITPYCTKLKKILIWLSDRIYPQQMSWDGLDRVGH